MRSRWTASVPLLAAAAMVGPSVTLALGVARGGYGLWNDFTSYWLAGRLVAAGRTPYDLTALARLGRHEGLAFQAGTGYSYPLPFAVAMVPLSQLPFTAAGWAFTALSLAVFGWAVASWLRDPLLGPRRDGVALGAALLAGFYPPVGGSLFFGQANLLVVGLLALGVRACLRFGAAQQLWGGLAIGLAGIVKVAPLALVLPLGWSGRLSAAAGLVAGAAGAVLAAILVAPFGLAGSTTLVELGTPDPYWTNQSLNGFVSRLTVRNERTIPFLRGLDPTVASWGLLAAFSLLVLLVLWRARARFRDETGFRLALGFTLAAAVAAAPKNSFWNHAPALIAVGLMLAPPAEPEGHRSADRTEAVLLGAWYALAFAQGAVDGLPDTTLRSLGPAGALLSSVALMGLLALVLALARELLWSGTSVTLERPP